jgi:hypothetical protein
MSTLEGEGGTMTDDSDPRSFGDALQCLLFNGRRRAQVRARLMRRLDQQLAPLASATDSDIERVEQDAKKLIEFAGLFLAVAPLSSVRNPGQKLADLKTELATRFRTKRVEGFVPHADPALSPALI